MERGVVWAGPEMEIGVVWEIEERGVVWEG